MDNNIIKLERNTHRVCPFRTVTESSLTVDLAGVPVVTQTMYFPECYYASCYYYDKEKCTKVERSIQ